MAITAHTGPHVVFGQALTSTGGVAEYNGQAGPSLFYQGAGILDPRAPYTYVPGNAVTYQVRGWLGTTQIPVVDQVPTTISTNSVAQTQVPTAGTALTLTASNTNNVTINQSITAPEDGTTVTGLRAIDTAMATVTFGSDATISYWNPATAISRAITITTASTGQNDGGAYWSVAGRDIYGYKMTEQIAGSTGGGTLTSAKTYKYITGITPVNSTGMLASTGVIVGVSDVFGFPLRVDSPGYVEIWWGNLSSNAQLVVSSTAQIIFAATATATSTTGDVRGKFTSSAASNNSLALQIFITPKVANIGTTAGLLGITQYSSI